MPIRRIPSLNWLRVFEAAARAESFTGAARILNMSAAAVSQQIKALEGHLDTKLFERGARTVCLSEAGSAFLPVVRQSLMSVETMAASLFGHAGGATLTVQATVIFATSWLAPRLPAFEAAHPDIQLHVMGAYHDTDINRIGPDLHVVFGMPPGSLGDSDVLFGETLFPVARPDIAAAIAKPEDLLNHRMIEISTHRTSWLQLLQAVPDMELAHAKFCFADSTGISLAMAAAGYGIALARAPASDVDVEHYGLQPCLPGFQIEGTEAYHLVYGNETLLSAQAKCFRHWLLEEAAAGQPGR